VILVSDQCRQSSQHSLNWYHPVRPFAVSPNSGDRRQCVAQHSCNSTSQSLSYHMIDTDGCTELLFVSSSSVVDNTFWTLSCKHDIFLQQQFGICNLEWLWKSIIDSFYIVVWDIVLLVYDNWVICLSTGAFDVMTLCHYRHWCCWWYLSACGLQFLLRVTSDLSQLTMKVRINVIVILVLFTSQHQGWIFHTAFRHYMVCL